jgi:hypothetical protein
MVKPSHWAFLFAVLTLMLGTVPRGKDRTARKEMQVFRLSMVSFVSNIFSPQFVGITLKKQYPNLPNFFLVESDTHQVNGDYTILG